MEFAKRFRVRDLSKDISPVSLKGVMNSYHLYAVCHKYPVKRFATASKDENLVRFGHLWRCYDLIGSLGWRPPILPADNTTFPGWLLGGGDGKAFLVQSFGLTQPRAGRGVVYHESTLTIHHKRSKVHRRLGRMYVRPTTSYTSETSAAFQYDEKEVRLVPKKSNCELRPILWPVFLRVRKLFSYHKRKKELLATE